MNGPQSDEQLRIVAISTMIASRDRFSALGMEIAVLSESLENLEYLQTNLKTKIRRNAKWNLCAQLAR